jgi:transforming growth factor-beta-induced protein
MRKLSVLLVVISLLTVSLVPAFGQDDDAPNIVEIAASDENFSTLVTAVDAAGLVETLSSEGPFTVFAPTNDAFAALPPDVLDALLADTELLTEVLLYHVVSGDVRAETVVTLDEAETVGGEIVSVTTNDDGVFLNDSTAVVQTDIVASNGVIHVIDTVLVPSSVMARVRVAHFSPDTPAVDVYVNGELSGIQGLEYPTVTGWVDLMPGTYNIAVSPADTSIDDAAIGPVDLSFGPGTFTTIAAHGSLSNGTLQPSVIAENYRDVEGTEADITLFHAIEDAPAVDVLADGNAIVNQLGYPGTVGDGFFEATVPAGTYDITVVPSPNPETTLFDLSGTALEAGKAYFVAAVGTLAEDDDADPTTIVAVTNLESVLGLEVPDEARAATEASEEASSTIVDIAVEDGRFTTLVDAVTTAGLAETLSAEGSFTVFAPTDDAFAALPEGTLESLSAEQLTDILLYHVVDGAVMAETVVTLDSATTLLGEDVTITVQDGSVFLNEDIQVIITDIEASNGVIHVIDGVLLPPME